jgi:hypothetical protein
MHTRLLLILLFLSCKSYCQDIALENNDNILKIEESLKKMGLGRGMEQSVTPAVKVTGLKHWEEDTLTQYTYAIPDGHDGTLTATVIMYNADIHRIANWIYFSLLDCNRKASIGNVGKIIKHMKEVSGFQFPVRGIVYEDLYNDKKKRVPDGIQETYFFFDGISVSHKKIKILTYNPSGIPQRVKEEKAILQMPEEDIEKAFVYGRICNTQREEYSRFRLFKKQVPVNVEGINFMFTVREEYKKAMHGKRNNLIAAWVLSNIL